MGLRGPGAKPVAKVPVKSRASARLSWQKPGLTRVERVVKFIESCPVTSGTFAGKKFKLRPFQRQIINGIYRTNSHGRRLVRTAVLSMPRKQGKTGLTAVLALCHLVGPEAEPRGQVYSAAAERNQAALLYEEMKAIIARVPWMSERIIVRDFTKKLEDVVTGSVYYALSAEATTKHGFNTSCWIYDELAQAKDRKLYDVLSTSTAAREEPLGIVISTQSPDPKHIMSELVDYGIQVRDGVVEDESFFAAIYSAPMESDPWDEKTWFDCNPALGDFRSLEEMRDFAAQAQRMPAREATFRLLYLNQRVASETRFIPQADWDACGVEKIDMERLIGQSCFGGLDLSGKNDLTALVLVFPQDKIHIALPFFWTPEDGIEEAEDRDRAPYRLWVREGHLIATPGRVIDYHAVALKLAELSKRYKIESIMFDRWKIDWLVRDMDKIGLNLKLIPAGQGFKDMDPAVEALEDCILQWGLRHPNNPVLTWCLDNVRVTRDPAGNRKFDKIKATGRIDGAVALAMAENLATIQPETKPKFKMFFV